MVELGVDVAPQSGEMDSMKCHWINLFDDDEKKSLEDGLIVAGALSIILGLWLNISMILSHELRDPSYKNLQNFTIVACLRRIIPFIAKVPFFKTSEIVDGLDIKSCQFLAFIETFMAVYEVEALTHVCIERYVVAKYVVNGWPIKSYHYDLFQALCFLFAGLYSFPSLFGIGRFGLDFTCSSCTFDIILPSTWERYLVAAIFFLRSIKPAMFMFAMLFWSRTLEKKLIFCICETTHNQNIFTRNIMIITALNLLCWLPIALIRGSVILTQLLYSGPIILQSGINVKWAMWIHWVSPALTAMVLFLIDSRIRKTILHPCIVSTTEQDSKTK